MYQTIFFSIFLAIVCSFGFVTSRFFLKEKRVFVLVPLSILIGLNGFNFLINVLSYFVPIQRSVWIILISFLITVSTILFLKRKEVRSYETVLSKRQYTLLFSVAFLISFFSGIVAIKSLALDDLFIGHIPLATTIAEGNFPVVDPSAPDHALSYHYGSDLLSALFKLIANVPIWLGYDIQIIIFSGSLFLFLFAFLFEITSRFRTSILGAFLFLYGTGLQWLYGITEGVPTFWHRFILHENVTAFWKFLTYVAFPKLNSSFIQGMNNHSTAIGMPVIFLVLYIYFRSLTISSRKMSSLYAIVAGLLYGYVALNLETYYVIVFIALLVMFSLGLLAKRWPTIGARFPLVTKKHFFISTAIVLFVGVSVAFLQGGILASLFTDTDREKLVLVSSVSDFLTLNFAPNPAQIDNSETYIKLFSFDFFTQFGLPLILIIPAIIFFYRRKMDEFLYVALIGGGAFLVPLFFRFPSRVWEVSRFFMFAIPIFSLVVGVYLSLKLDETKKKKIRGIIIGALILVGLSGVCMQALFALSNLDRFGSLGPLVMRPSSPLPIEEGLFSWIHENTTLQDRFFPYSADFIRYSGRFTPGDPQHFGFSQRQIDRKMYEAIINRCSIDAFQYLKITYLYVTPKFPITNYELCLEKLKAISVYSNQQGTDFRSLYKIDL